MSRLRLFLMLATVVSVLASAHAQESQPQYGKYLFNIGGGVGFPLGDLGRFVNNGGNVVIGGGYNFIKNVGVDTEFMWQDLPINSATKQLLLTSGASARQYSWTFNPIVHFPLGARLGAYAIGGIGWYHRSGETTTPGVGVVCDPFWSWWYGCTLGSVNFVTASRSENSFGENIGGGVSVLLGEGHTKIYAEVRYHHAGYNTVSTQILPLTFGLRW
jgi:opacity protein-like surface antigen